jgi:hypothetical protein
MPASSICRRASGRTVPEGWLPALNAVKSGVPFRLKMASAMIERAEFPVQRNRTLYRDMDSPFAQQPGLQHGATVGLVTSVLGLIANTFTLATAEFTSNYANRSDSSA